MFGNNLKKIGMKQNKLAILIAAMLLVSCSKDRTMYKYEYTTPKSVAIGATSSHLGDYDHMTKGQIEQERRHQRALVKQNFNEEVLSDTMYIY